MGLAGDDDVGAAGQGAVLGGEAVPGFAPHDDGCAECGAFEVCEVFGQVPGHFAVAPDGAVAGAGVDEVDGGWCGWGGLGVCGHGVCVGAGARGWCGSCAGVWLVCGGILEGAWRGCLLCVF